MKEENISNFDFKIAIFTPPGLYVFLMQMYVIFVIKYLTFDKIVKDSLDRSAHFEDLAFPIRTVHVNLYRLLFTCGISYVGVHMSLWVCVF